MNAPETLILRREDIAGTMALADYIEAVELAFGQLADGGMSVPPVVHVPAAGGAFHVKSAGFASGPPYLAVKVNGNFPGNPAATGLPTIQGAILLCDSRNGSLLAVVDSAEVTAMRTGAATAVAAKYLARQNSETATVIGCGIQGRVQLLSLAEVLPLKMVRVFDLDRRRADAFAGLMRDETGLEVLPVDDFANATRASDVIVTCTSSRRAFLTGEHIAPGTFIAAVGADNHDKQELAPELLAGSRVVVDVLDQCAGIGELHHALEAEIMTRSDVAAELGAVVAGTAKVEFGPDDVVVFDSTGSAIQDVASAGIIYERAKAGGGALSVAFS